MAVFGKTLIRRWNELGPRYMPFADAASADLPLSRLLRLSLFQVSVGMVTALMVGTLNRVMIVELNVPATWVAIMIALPIVVAPLRALIGFRSDHHRSAIGWRRVPYIWMGAMLQFAGLAIMPFALLLLSGDGNAPMWVAQAAAGLAFVVAGAGIQIAQTGGLALATDLADERTRPRVVALMYVSLLLGILIAGFVYSLILANFSPLRLIQAVQGSAVVAIVLNVVALWKQEARRPNRGGHGGDLAAFSETWGAFVGRAGVKRFLIAVGLGSAAFAMQDVILEPYGAEVLGMGVGSTTALTAIQATGALIAFAIAARLLAAGFDPYRLAGYAAVAGIPAFSAVIMAAPFGSSALFAIGTLGIGFGGGLFAVATLTSAMALESGRANGLALGAWGAVQATAAGLAIAIGGALRDLFSQIALSGALGEALAEAATGYGLVYHIELFLLFATLAAIGPLASHARRAPAPAANSESSSCPAEAARNQGERPCRSEPSRSTSTSHRWCCTSSGSSSPRWCSTCVRRTGARATPSRTPRPVRSAPISGR